MNRAEEFFYILDRFKDRPSFVYCSFLLFLLLLYFLDTSSWLDLLNAFKEKEKGG